MESTSRIRVGILEDEQTLREALCGMLTESGLEVVAQSGQRQPFLNQVRQLLPDVVIVDLRITRPDTDEVESGLDVVREIRELGSQIRSLVLSGSRDSDTVENCMNEGADGFLWKLTAGRETIVKAVETLARGERFIPAECFEMQPNPQPHARPERLSQLTPRELEVLSHIAEGEDNLKIAACLGITERTVKAHVTSLYRRLNLENRAQMALLAFQLGAARMRKA